ncbi:hypothetical protein GCM10007423_42750 [Dyadobacter endophyticus]|uniref:Uncharacterized protein n=2 Tax=Dyadobacter endophyticus TaxID=1749036 RepID=A0ABQ1Z1A2_9BACT|nr:hypothetical protein GCM10007423_42750 [Dyadobacter endophyticus]
MQVIRVLLLANTKLNALMKTIQFFLHALLLTTLLASCKTTTILTSKFESETIGSLPAKNLPGDPTGDEITYSTELQPRIKVTASATAGQKSLTFTEINTPGLTAHNQFLSFKGISTDFTQTLWFMFTATHSGSGERMLIDVTDGSAGMITRMFITETGQLSMMTNFSGGEQVLGNIPTGVSHTIIVTLNLSSKKFNLTVLKSGGNITLTDRPVLIDNVLAYANPAQPSLHFRWDDGASATRKYVLEEVLITRKKPDM